MLPINTSPTSNEIVSNSIFGDQAKISDNTRLPNPANNPTSKPIVDECDVCQKYW